VYASLSLEIPPVITLTGMVKICVVRKEHLEMIVITFGVPSVFYVMDTMKCIEIL